MDPQSVVMTSPPPTTQPDINRVRPASWTHDGREMAKPSAEGGRGTEMEGDWMDEEDNDDWEPSVTFMNPDDIKQEEEEEPKCTEFKPTGEEGTSYQGQQWPSGSRPSAG